MNEENEAMLRGSRHQEGDSWLSKLLLIEPGWILLWAVPILMPGVSVPPTLRPALLAALFLFWPVRWFDSVQVTKETARSELRRYVMPPVSPLTLAMLSFLLWLCLSLWVSPQRLTSWRAGGYLLVGLALHVALVNWKPTRNRPEWVAWFMLSIGIVLSLLAPIITAWKREHRLFHLPIYDLMEKIPVDAGDTIHANILAGVLVLILPLAVALAICRSRLSSTQRWIFILTATLFLLVILLTQSRGGYLAMLISLALVIGLRWPKLFYLFAIIVVGAIAAGSAMGIDSVLQGISRDGSLGGWDGRVHIWTLSIRAIRDFAFTGIGIGNFAYVIPLLYPIRVDITGFPHAHNLLLQVGVDLGLPGLVAHLALWINAVILAVAVLHSPANRAAAHQPSLTRPLVAGALGGMTAMWVHGMLDASTWVARTAAVPWVGLALIVLLFLQMKEARG